MGDLLIKVSGIQTQDCLTLNPLLFPQLKSFSFKHRHTDTQTHTPPHTLSILVLKWRTARNHHRDLSIFVLALKKDNIVDSNSSETEGRSKLILEPGGKAVKQNLSDTRLREVQGPRGYRGAKVWEVETVSEGLLRNWALREEKGITVRSGNGMRFQREEQQVRSTEDYFEAFRETLDEIS